MEEDYLIFMKLAKDFEINQKLNGLDLYTKNAQSMCC